MQSKIYYIVAAVLMITHAVQAGPIQEITNSTEFDKILRNNDIVLVQFYSNGCPHCMNFKRAGIYQGLASELTNIAFLKVESEDGSTIHHKYGITAFPTFMLFKNGNKVGVKQGFQHKEPLKQFIKQSLAK